jgi:IPT/TIG domain
MTYGFFSLVRGIALCALPALAGTAYAQTDILSAAADANLTSITIKGTGLQPPSGKPTVSLGSYMVPVGSNFSNVQIIAALPPNLKPGTYNLEVTANGTANLDVTIGAGGPAGPAGPAGAAGPAGPAGPQGAPGASMSLPFSGSVAFANGTAFTIANTAGTGITGIGGVTGATGQAGVSASGGSAATSGGPAFQGTGGTGEGGGDGIDVTGGATASGASGGGGAGVVANGGAAAGLNQVGGAGIIANGGAGDLANDGIQAQGGSTISGCSICFGGNGGTFYGGNAGPGIEAGSGVLAEGGIGGVGVYAIGQNTPTYSSVAGLFGGDVEVIGNLAKSGGSFKIDHPTDPANKYLYHSFVESPDMKNVYDGTIVTDGGGHATVTLPDWFEALNSDFRYQLTVIGQFAHAIVASEVHNNAFAIRTDKPNVKVSWQVTGIRQDAWANAHRIPVEVEKAKADQGHFLHPELFEHAGEPGIIELHHPRPKQRVQQ